ncbi:hypothetical protein ScPMuIL_012509 [Solemya velum]
MFVIFYCSVGTALISGSQRQVYHSLSFDHSQTTLLQPLWLITTDARHHPGYPRRTYDEFPTAEGTRS